MRISRRERSRMIKYNLINDSLQFQLPDTAVSDNCIRQFC